MMIQRLFVSVALLLLAIAPRAFAQAHVHGGSDEKSNAPLHQKHPVDPSIPDKLTGELVDLAIPGGPAGKAYVSRPAAAPAGAVLVLHEWWGLNDHIKHEADKLAKQGYLALAVDLYDGKVGTTPEEAGKLMQGLDLNRARAVEKAGLGYLREQAKGKKIATLGWCMGGAQSLIATLTDPDAVSATVIYYGIPLSNDGQIQVTVDDLKKLKGPVLGIWAKKDGWITQEKVAAFDKLLTQAGVKHEFHSYDADHAFANPTGGKYNPPAAKDADQKRDAFLKKHLRS